MHIDSFLWMFLPVFVAGGSALLSYCIMQAKMEVALARERESLAEARATITSQKITMEERIKATEEASRRHALDEFMQDFRVEERSYVRESKSLAAYSKSMILQERLFFRNIPLSNWIEREMLVEEGRDLDQLPKESVFSSPALSTGVLATGALAASEGRLPISKFLSDFGGNEVPAHRESGHDAATLIAARIPAFGAQ